MYGPIGASGVSNGVEWWRWTWVHVKADVSSPGGNSGTPLSTASRSRGVHGGVHRGDPPLSVHPDPRVTGPRHQGQGPCVVQQELLGEFGESHQPSFRRRCPDQCLLQRGLEVAAEGVRLPGPVIKTFLYAPLRVPGPPLFRRRRAKQVSTPYVKRVSTRKGPVPHSGFRRQDPCPRTLES